MCVCLCKNVYVVCVYVCMCNLRRNREEKMGWRWAPHRPHLGQGQMMPLLLHLEQDQEEEVAKTGMPTSRGEKTGGGVGIIVKGRHEEVGEPAPNLTSLGFAILFLRHFELIAHSFKPLDK